MVAVISWWALDGFCYFLVGSGWLLLFPGGLRMVTDISWWALDGCCYFLVGSGWFLIFLGGLWMVTAISWWAQDGWLLCRHADIKKTKKAKLKKLQTPGFDPRILGIRS